MKTIIEMAFEAGLVTNYGGRETASDELLNRFAALVRADERERLLAGVGMPEPDAYLFQHEETGNTMFVDAQQVEWGFEKANPRLQKISGAYTAEQRANYTLNSTKTVAVAVDTYWIPIDKDTPRSAKLQLLSIGGVAQYGTLSGDVSFYTHWCPVPKKPK